MTEHELNKLESTCLKWTYGLTLGGMVVGGTVSHITKNPDGVIYGGLSRMALGLIPVIVMAISYTRRNRETHYS